MHFYKPDKVAALFQQFAKPYQNYAAREDFHWNEYKKFITEDEINAYFTRGSNYSDSRLRFSPSVETVVKKESVNPKRLQRQIRKETAATGIGTKSQQALQMQREENKLVRKALSRKQREAEKQRQFELKQQKRKEKHRGR